MLIGQILAVPTGAAFPAVDAPFIDGFVICHAGGGDPAITDPGEASYGATGRGATGHGGPDNPGMAGCDLCPVCQNGGMGPALAPPPPGVPMPRRSVVASRPIPRRIGVDRAPLSGPVQPRAPPHKPSLPI